MPQPTTEEEGLMANRNEGHDSNDSNVIDSNAIDSSDAATATTTTLALRPLVRGEPEPQPEPQPEPRSEPQPQPQPASVAVDLRALDYPGAVDENLVCPICRVALVAPVVTACDHVFCHRCLVQAHALNPVCPVDRRPLKLVADTRPAPKVVQNQLDGLPVRCPNRGRGCELVVARSLVENHVTRYCDKTLVPCPDPTCNRSVARRHVAKGCLHYAVVCEYCEQPQQMADLDRHRDDECPNRNKNCDACAAEYVRSKQDEHAKECPQVETACKFAPFGCRFQMARRLVRQHEDKCDYRVVGPIGEQLAQLRAEMSSLQERDRLKDRRIKFLENRGFALPTPSTSDPMSDMGLLDSSASTETAPYESRDAYFLSLFETMESKVERVSSALTEVECRHNMMLYNETLQIKEQLTDIRSTLGVLGMHVRWLMNFRLQERGRAGTSAPAMPGSFAQHQSGSSGSSSNGNNNDSHLPRRLSDSLRENPPRL